MSEVDPQRVKEILAQALGMEEPNTRDTYLSEVCRDDSKLRSEVESLLDAHCAAGDFLGRSVMGDDIDPFAETAGGKVGPYRLKQKLGEGGFGVVYLAEQERPIRRKVALKIIKLGMDTKEVLARFESERQALAMLAHPYIARVYDAGMTDRGRSYFSMELVIGEPITDYCVRLQLSVAQRLEVFLQVCEAVQHAHQKGIIHRDLKPSNIAVTELDGRPSPKVIDFGIAKSMNTQLTEKTLQTRKDNLIGTPTYMSPEQFGMAGEVVDTRSDIYSLGVLLYELLTGSTPLEREKSTKLPLDEIRRWIREREWEKPSARLKRGFPYDRPAPVDSPVVESVALDEKNDRMLPRHQLKKLMIQLRGDLDWIVMKALEKEPARRYETVNALADDLHRYLGNAPVSARPPSLAYQLLKFARRHRMAAISGAGILVSLIVGFVATSIGFAEARKQRAEATKQHAEAKAIVDLLRDMMAAGRPRPSLHQEYTVREMLDSFSEGLDQKLEGRGQLESEIRDILARTYNGLGFFEAARLHHERALELRLEAYGNQHPKVAESMVQVAVFTNEDRERALDLFCQAISIFSSQKDIDGEALYHALRGRADTMRRMGDWKSARQDYEELLRIAEETGMEGDSRLCMVWSGLALVSEAEGDLANAESLHRKAVAVARTGSDELHIAYVSSRLSGMLMNRGQHGHLESFVEVEKIYRKILPVYRRSLGEQDELFVTTERLLREALEAQSKTPAEIESVFQSLHLSHESTR